MKNKFENIIGLALSLKDQGDDRLATLLGISESGVAPVTTQESVSEGILALALLMKEEGDDSLAQMIGLEENKPENESRVSKILAKIPAGTK